MGFICKTEADRKLRDGDNANDCVQNKHISDAIHRLKERMPDAQIKVVACDPPATKRNG